MRLIPIYKADAEKRPWTVTAFYIFAVLSIIGGIWGSVVLEGIVSAVVLFALGRVIDCLHVIACNSRGYYVEYDDPEIQAKLKEIT